MDQTLRRFGGRQPLCGIGVTSLIDLTWSPADASAWMADSRPLPGPCTRTWTRLTPAVNASRAACSAATVAANGVLFFDPLKPALPEEPHETVLPCKSVMVTVVLLKVALTCAIPSGSTTRFAFFPVAITWSPYSCRRSRGVDPSSCVHSYACAVRAPAVRDDAGYRDTNRCPSAA